MNTHDIELPPLPPADRYFEFDSHRMKASIDIPYWGEKSLEAYARSAVEPYAKRIAELEAQIEADHHIEEDGE